MLVSVIDENTLKYTSKNKKKLGYYSILYLCSISIILENVRKALVFGLFLGGYRNGILTLNEPIFKLKVIFQL